MRPGGGGLTDFIVSKVAMSVAALVTIGVASGVFELCMAPDMEGELEGVLEDLVTRLALLASAGPGSTTSWTVPGLSTGGCVTVQLETDALSATSPEGRAFREPPVEIHTWRWDGTRLNGTVVEALDLEATPLRAASGSAVVIETVPLAADGRTETLLLVRADS